MKILRVTVGIILSFSTTTASSLYRYTEPVIWNSNVELNETKVHQTPQAGYKNQTNKINYEDKNDETKNSTISVHDLKELPMVISNVDLEKQFNVNQSHSRSSIRNDNSSIAEKDIGNTLNINTDTNTSHDKYYISDKLYILTINDKKSKGKSLISNSAYKNITKPLQSESKIIRIIQNNKTNKFKSKFSKYKPERKYINKTSENLKKEYKYNSFKNSVQPEKQNITSEEKKSIVVNYTEGSDLGGKQVVYGMKLKQDNQSKEFENNLLRRKKGIFARDYLHNSIQSHEVYQDHQIHRDHKDAPGLLYRNQNPLTGEYRFGYNAGNHWRQEKRTKTGVVKGSYGWTDGSGTTHVTRYIADSAGYRVIPKGHGQIPIYADPPPSFTTSSSWIETNNVYKPLDVTSPPKNLVDPAHSFSFDSKDKYIPMTGRPPIAYPLPYIETQSKPLFDINNLQSQPTINHFYNIPEANKHPNIYRPQTIILPSSHQMTTSNNYHNTPYYHPGHIYTLLTNKLPYHQNYHQSEYNPYYIQQSQIDNTLNDVQYHPYKNVINDASPLTSLYNLRPLENVNYFPQNNNHGMYGINLPWNINEEDHKTSSTTEKTYLNPVTLINSTDESNSLDNQLKDSFINMLLENLNRINLTFTEKPYVQTHSHFPKPSNAENPYTNVVPWTSSVIKLNNKPSFPIPTITPDYSSLDYEFLPDNIFKNTVNPPTPPKSIQDILNHIVNQDNKNTDLNLETPLSNPNKTDYIGTVKWKLPVLSIPESQHPKQSLVKSTQSFPPSSITEETYQDRNKNLLNTLEVEAEEVKDEATFNAGDLLKTFFENMYNSFRNPSTPEPTMIH